MKTISLILAGFLMAVTAAMAGTVSYNTTGSTLSCNGVAGCVQNTSTSVTIGGLTFTYNAGSGSGVVTPSIINVGNIVSTGTGTNVNVTGLLLTINVNSTPPGASGTLPNGAISGTISTNNSGATITFSPNNTTTGFGTLPGVVISGGAASFTYQVLNPSLGLQAPTVGNPVGQTSIQGAVTDTSTITMTANTGTTPQSATVNTAFTNSLAVTVKTNGNPTQGVNVTFTAPGFGASGTFSNNTATITVATNALGIASAPFTANTTSGVYAVIAAASGAASVTFSLINTAGAPTSMTANAGTTPQSATVLTVFANAPAVTVKDAFNNPVQGVSVTFTAPGSGASGTFSNNAATIMVATNASGIASAPFTANGTAGGPYTVTAAASGLTTVNFSLTNLVGAAASMTANGGTTPQSATILTAFTNSLSVTVKDAGTNPVPGVNVTFTAPGSGASGIFSNATATITVATNASGIASAPFSANATAGGPYTVSAAASGVPNVGFSLTNLVGAPMSMTANAGTTPQTTSVNMAFGNSLAVTVKDAGTNPVPGVNVTFTAPASGASGTFSNATATITVATNASGIASAPFTANGTAGGPYTVTAAANGLTTVNFSLTNRPVVPPTFSKAFGRSTIYFNTGSNNTSLTFTIANPAANVIPLTNISFSDALPAGLAVDTPNGVTGSCGGGIITAAAGSNLITLTGATLTAGDSCTFSVQVTGADIGTQVNTTSSITADGGVVGAAATASIVVSPLIYYWFYM